MIPPLAIVPARLASTRLERKMLLDLGGHPLIWSKGGDRKWDTEDDIRSDGQ